MHDMQQIRQDIIDSSRVTVETCRLIETRMVDNYVLATEDGDVLHNGSGVHPFGQKLDKVERSRDLTKVKGLLAHVRENNPDNHVAQGLKIMGWKKAARLQRARFEAVIEEMTKAMDDCEQ